MDEIVKWSRKSPPKPWIIGLFALSFAVWFVALTLVSFRNNEIDGMWAFLCAGTFVVWLSMARSRFDVEMWNEVCRLREEVEKLRGESRPKSDGGG